MVLSAMMSLSQYCLMSLFSNGTRTCWYHCIAASLRYVARVIIIIIIIIIIK
jgi:hypothetical protein